MLLQCYQDDGLTICDDCKGYNNISYKFCKNCGKDLNENTVVCTNTRNYYGKLVPCNVVVSKDYNFCPECGGRLHKLTDAEIKQELDDLKNFPPPSPEELAKYVHKPVSMSVEVEPEWYKKFKNARSIK